MGISKGERMGNESLNKAKKKADDEFYTRYEDVEKELRHYVSQFKDKTVYCNCDIPLESAFSLWFIKNFNAIGLKRLICTSYNPKLCLDLSEVADSISDRSTDGEVRDALSSQIRPLKEDGDFRSFESMQYLRQADIVVTNPPFSLFREVVQLITDFGKDFLLVGNLNAVTYKSIFPLIKDNKARLGYNFGHMVFRVPDTVKEIGSSAFRKCKSLKSLEIPEAIRKGKEDAMKKLITVSLDENESITHDLKD